MSLETHGASARAPPIMVRREILDIINFPPEFERDLLRAGWIAIPDEKPTKIRL